MKQIIQNYRTGVLELAEVPVPMCSSDTLLVRNVASLISIGTERSVIELGQKNLLGKARARPDLLKRFVDKAKKEGLLKTFQEALGRLDTPTALGYSSAGIVAEVGKNIHKFAVGDRVACIGAGYASHASYIKVPENLCCRITDQISFEEASFGMLGIIALHGLRCAKLNFGGSVALIGLGLLGLLSVQMLKAYGCRVIGTDLDPAKIELASSLGADMAVGSKDFKKACDIFSEGMGVDAVILTVATKSDDPVHTAVDVSRFGGRVICVGVADIHPQRNEMWHKEVEIIVSRAGGPGTFDPLYENKGIDYPPGYVRWTENRNLAEFLRLVSEGKVDVRPLISHRYDIEKAEDVYRNIMANKGGPYIGVILQYPEDSGNGGGHRLLDRKLPLKTNERSADRIERDTLTLGVIGAGLFGKALLLPALKKIPDVHLAALSTSSSTNVYHTAKKYGFETCTTDYWEVLKDKDIHAVVILTPHSMHAKMITEALQEKKHVFVEKPMCISEKELQQIIEVHIQALDRFLMVGNNRRFSPHATKMAEYLKNRRDPMVMNYRVNAGFVPSDHWVHSKAEGGSRVIGEMCHFVDVLQFLTKSNPVRVFSERISGNNKTSLNSDNVTITLKFEDGSVGNIIYSASGDKAFSREQVEIFCEGSSIVSTDYKHTLLYRNGKKKSFKTINQEMGYKEELQHFADVALGRVAPRVSPAEYFYSTQAIFCVNTSLETGKPVLVALP